MSLQVIDVDVSYSHKKVLSSVSLRVDADEIVALIGHNGAGKTTMLKAILGSLRTDRGRISFQGRDVNNRKPQHNVRDGIVYCPQGGEVFRRLTVVENLEVATLTGANGTHKKEAIDRVFELFPALVARKDFKGGVLSGGERQMLSLGMALMLSPKLFLIDEPSGGLSPLYVDRVFESIVRINRDFRTAILLVEQNLKHAFDISHRAYVLRNGQIAYEGTPEQLQSAMSEAFFGF